MEMHDELRIDEIEFSVVVSVSDTFHDIWNLRKRCLLSHMLLHRNKGRFIYLRLENNCCSKNKDD